MDESLLQCLKKVQSGAPGAFAELSAQYRPLVLSLVDSFLPSMPLASLSREDLVQEANIALYRAAMRFHLEQEQVTFGLYAKVCIKNRLVSTLRRQRRLAKKPPKVAPDTEPSTKTDLVTLRRDYGQLLTDYEKQVLALRIESYSYKEIAAKLATDPKSVDNALCRIRSKIRKEKKRFD